MLVEQSKIQDNVTDTTSKLDPFSQSQENESEEESIKKDEKPNQEIISNVATSEFESHKSSNFEQKNEHVTRGDVLEEPQSNKTLFTNIIQST